MSLILYYYYFGFRCLSDGLVMIMVVLGSEIKEQTMRSDCPEVAGPSRYSLRKQRDQRESLKYNYGNYEKLKK